MARTRPDAYQIEPGAEGEIMRVVGGVVTWIPVSSVAGEILVSASGITEASIIEGAAPGAGITGTPDGVGSAFVLASAAVDEEAIHVYLDGLRMMMGAGNDYTVLGDLQTVVFEYPPHTGQNIVIDYRVP